MFGAISPTEEIGLILVPLMNSVLNLLAGFLIPASAIPGYYIWIYWINPNAYYLSGVLKAVLTGLEFVCTEDELAAFPYPGNTDDSYEFPDCESIPPESTRTLLKPLQKSS